MSLFGRIKNIIRSNIKFNKDINIDNINIDFDVDLNSYKETYYDDAKENVNSNDVERQYYKILEVEYGADFSEIKKAYKKLLKKYHPDFFAGSPEKMETAQKLTKKINEAYTYFERKFL